MSYQGDIRLGATIEFTFTTRRFSTGVPFTLAGTPSIEAYQTGSSTPITTGITLTADYSSVTGLNHVSIVASSGNGFATAKDVSVVIAAGTVDSVSVVGETIGSFSIENRSALMPTTASRTLDVSAGGEAGIDWANIGSPTTAQNLSATNIDTDQVVASVSGAVGSVTGNVGGNVTGSVGSVVGAVGSVTGNVGGNVTGSVGSVATNGISAASIDSDAANKIADHVIRRNNVNIESSTDGDTLDIQSLYGAIAASTNKEDSTTNVNKITVFKADRTTELGQLDSSSDAAAQPLVSIG